MAIELCSESSPLGMSPRISFSHDLTQTDVVPVEKYIRTNSSSSVDFDFCVFRQSFDQESSSADELFFDGKILPIEIKKRLSPPPKRAEPAPPPPPRASTTPNSGKTLKTEKPIADQTEEKQSSKSFWGFKRSASLNCGSGYARTLCPIPLLSRSNSTGSSSSVKRSSNSKETLNQKQQFLHKPSYVTGPQKQSQRPPLKKNHGFYGNNNNNNGVKINPILNVSTANLLGFGLIFSSGKDKNKKK